MTLATSLLTLNTFFQTQDTATSKQKETPRVQAKSLEAKSSQKNILREMLGEWSKVFAPDDPFHTVLPAKIHQDCCGVFGLLRQAPQSRFFHIAVKLGR